MKQYKQYNNLNNISKNNLLFRIVFNYYVN